MRENILFRILVLPGAIGKGLSIIISPLLALIQDQLAVLNGVKIPSITINSLISESDRKDIEAGLSRPEGPAYKFLFLTPEQCAVQRTRVLLQGLAERKAIRAIVVDEAHCISGKI